MIHKMMYKWCISDIRGQTFCMHTNLEQKKKKKSGRGISGLTGSCRHSRASDLPAKTSEMKMERLTLRDITSTHYHAVFGILWDTWYLTKGLFFALLLISTEEDDLFELYGSPVSPSQTNFNVFIGFIGFNVLRLLDLKPMSTSGSVDISARDLLQCSTEDGSHCVSFVYCSTYLTMVGSICSLM